MLTLVICLPTYDHNEIVFDDSFGKLLIPGRVDPRTGEKWPGRTIIMRKYDHPIREARTILTQEALGCVPDADYILWIDSDMQFAPTAAMRLIQKAEEHDLDIVGGLCFNRRHPYAPTLFKRWPAEMCRSGYGFCYHYPKGELFEVDATGHGFILIRPDVYRKLREDEGDEWYMPIDGEMSEDVGFCVRAKKAGFKVLVDTGCHIGHLAKIVVDEAFAEKNREFELATYLDPQEVKMLSGGELVVTVVIPTYNQKPNYLRSAILSAAYQTVPTKVIVVDDGSDEPVNIGWCRSDNVELIRHDKNRGIAAALNTGIEAMATPWFCWLSSDDLFDSRKVQYQLSVAQQSGAKALFTSFQIETSSFPRIIHGAKWTTMEEQRSMLGMGCAIFGSTIMVHKDVIDEVGLFDTSYKYGQDWEWFCRIGQKHHWQLVPAVAVTRRENNNLTQQIEANEEKTRCRNEEDQLIIRKYRLGYVSDDPVDRMRREE